MVSKYGKNRASQLGQSRLARFKKSGIIAHYVALGFASSEWMPVAS
jgi:hypothetical protein